MTSVVLRTLIAVTLLAHSALGCCWHHGHDDAPAALAEGAATPHCCAHADAHPAAELAATTGHKVEHCGAPEPSHEHPAACDEPDCSFVTVRQCSLPGVDVSAQFADLVPPTAIATTCTAGATNDINARVAPVAAPLRAALQIWLI